jgi:hypothetical protein
MYRCLLPVALTFVVGLPAATLGETLQTKDRLALVVTAEGRASVMVGGKPLPAGDSPSGVLFRDVAAGGEFVPAGGTLAAQEGGLTQSGTNEPLGVDFRAEYVALPTAVRIAGHVHDLTGKDRAVTVRFAIPLDAVGGLWWNDLRSSEEIARKTYNSVRATGIGATGSSSAYTWSAVTTAAGQLSLAIPLDHFVVHRIEYDGQARSFYVDFDFGLSPLTKAFPSRADFVVYLYVSGPEWGFRSATAAYYALFPEAFRRRSTREGLWMPFTDLAKVEDQEDFNFAFQEGANNIAYDEEHGVYSFYYISPHWAWTWMPDRQDRPTPEYVKQRLAEDLQSPNDQVRRAAQLASNSGARDRNGDLHFTIGSAHWAPSNFGPVGWYASYPANADPDLEKLGRGPTTGSETMQAVEKLIAQYHTPQAFLDGFYFDGVDERPVDNYATDHFPFAEAPLTFATDTHRPVLCGPFASYKFLKRVAERVHSTGRLTMANGIPSIFPFSVAYLDIGGSEQEPPIESDPVPLSYLLYSRALLYHKPLVLLYKPRLEERFDRDLTPYLLDYLNECLPYVAEPSLFKLFSDTNPEFYHSFFERPDWYNRYRRLFIEYAPLVRDLAEAGWEPVTCARASDKDLIVERFGSGEGLSLVAYNPTHERTIACELRVDLPRAGWPAEATPRAGDLVEGAVAPVQSCRGGVLTLSLSVPPRRSLVLAIRPRQSQLAVRDGREALRYLGIGGSRLQDKISAKPAVDFKRDPDGDGAPTGWAKYSEGTVAYSSDARTFHSPPQAVRVELDGKSRATLAATLPVSSARKYRLGFWTKADLPAGGSVHVYGRWKDKAGKDLTMVPPGGEIRQSTDWAPVQVEATSPEAAAALALVLVATKSDAGRATVWLDDPSLVEVQPDGRETVLLPAPSTVPPASAQALLSDLKAATGPLAALVSAADRGDDPAKLCTEALSQAAGLQQKAEAVRKEQAGYANVAAALDVSAGRLRRAATILNGWQMRLTARNEVAAGETPEISVQLTGGSGRLSGLTVTAQAPQGWEAAAVRTTGSLAPGQTLTLPLTLQAGAPQAAGGAVTVTATAEVAPGLRLSLERQASFSIVSPCESRLVDEGLNASGGGERLLLVAQNTRREKPLPVKVGLVVPSGFSADSSEKTALIPAGREMRFPIGLTAASATAAGWRAVRVTVTWEGGSRTHDLPMLYVPPAANLLPSPGFEEMQAGLAVGWSKYGEDGYTLDAATAHGGKASLVAAGNMSGACRHIVLNQPSPKPLIVRGWSLYQRPGAQVATIGQTEQAAAANRTVDYSLYADLHFQDGTALHGQTAPFDKSVSGWQFSQKIVNVSKPIRDLDLYLLFRHQEGKAWFDDIVLAEGEPNLALMPGTTIAVDSTFGGYSTAPLVDGMTDTANVPWDRAAWASEEKKGEHWVEIAWPEERTVRSVVVYWALDGDRVRTSREWAAQAWVDGGWREVGRATGAEPQDLSVLSCDPVKTSRVRILQPEGGGHAARPFIMWVREIELH